MPEAQLTIQLDPLLLRELPLLLLELLRDVEQSLLDALGRHRLREERQVVAEHQDGGRVLDPLIATHQLLEKDRRHECHVLVTEPDGGRRAHYVELAVLAADAVQAVSNGHLDRGAYLRVVAILARRVPAALRSAQGAHEEDPLPRAHTDAELVPAL